MWSGSLCSLSIVLCCTQLDQVWVAACTCWFSDPLSELFSDRAVITLTMTLASPNRTSSPMMSLPLMVRSDSTAARRPSRRGSRDPGEDGDGRPDISRLASGRSRRRGPCG